MAETVTVPVFCECVWDSAGLVEPWRVQTWPGWAEVEGAWLTIRGVAV